MIALSYILLGLVVLFLCIKKITKQNDIFIYLKSKNNKITSFLFYIKVLAISVGIILLWPLIFIIFIIDCINNAKSVIDTSNEYEINNYDQIVDEHEIGPKYKKQNDIDSQNEIISSKKTKTKMLASSSKPIKKRSLIK